MNKNYDIQKIEKALCDAVQYGGLSTNVFRGQRPSKTDGMSSFIVVSVPTSLRDQSALGQCTSRIEIFVRNMSNGLKNSDMFSIIFEKLDSIFPIIHDTFLFNMYPTIIPLGNDNEGFHVQAININTIIKTV